MPSMNVDGSSITPASYLPKDSSTRLIGKNKRDSSVPVWRQPQPACKEIASRLRQPFLSGGVVDDLSISSVLLLKAATSTSPV
jgi:hypothetical protein